MNKAKYANCPVCPLQPYAICPSFGAKHPRLIVVGEGPGNREVALKKPFVGDSGEVLRTLLGDYGIDPLKDVYYTNATLCHPNTRDTKEKNERLRKAVEACHPRLMAAINQFPKATPVLALGKHAQAALGIGPNAWQRSPATGNWTIGTVHPAAAFHKPGSLVHTERVIEKVGRWLESPGQTPLPQAVPTPNIVWHEDSLPPFEEFTRWTVGPLCIDIESNSTVWYAPDSCIFMWGLAYRSTVTNQVETIILPESVLKTTAGSNWVKDFHNTFANRIGGHNYKFDALFQARQFGIQLEFGWDTILMVNVLNEHWLKGLKDLGSYYYDTGDWGETGGPDGWLKKHSGLKKGEQTYDKVPQDIMIEYLNLDVFINLLVYEQLQNDLQAVDRFELPYQEFEMPAAVMLTKMEYKGFPVDLNRVAEEEQSFEADQERAKQQVQEATGGLVENPNSPKQVGSYLWDVAEVSYPKHKGKYPSTAEPVLLAVKDEHPAVQAVLKYRRIAKLKNSYLTNLYQYAVQRPGQPLPTVHSSYLQAFVRTGRLSARKPAIQTIPKKDAEKDGDANYGQRIKSCYVAPPGYKLVFVDGSQWELRVATVWSGDPWMIDAYRSGMDVHGLACDAIYGPGWTKAQRGVEKNVMFGSLYGGSLESLVSVGSLSDAQKQWVLDFFYTDLKRMVEWREEMFKIAKNKQVIVSPHFNWHYHFPLITQRLLHDIQKTSVNYPVQGTASKITVDAAVHAQPKLTELGAHVVATVHDSVGILAPDNCAIQAAQVMAEELEQAGTRFSGVIPWVADAEIGTDWGHLMEVEL